MTTKWGYCRIVAMSFCEPRGWLPYLAIYKESGAEVKFKKINEAYEVLSDETKRKEYVQKLYSSNNSYSYTSWANVGINQIGIEPKNNMNIIIFWFIL